MLDKSPKECLLRLSDVIKRTGLSRSSIYSHMNKKSFPKSINIGLRSVAWLESDIDEWISERVIQSLNQSSFQNFSARKEEK